MYKNNILQTVVDGQQQNDNMVKDVTPLPDQDIICLDIARAKICSKIDLSDAYEQIRIIPEDMHKMVFTTIYGTFMSNVMQLGNGMGNLWVLLSVPIPVPMPTHTHNSRVTSDGSQRVQVLPGVGSVFLLIIYLITIIKPPYEQVLIGMGVDCRWAQRNERKKKEMAQETHVPWAREKKKKKKKNAQETSVSWAYPLITHHFPSSPSPLAWQVTWGPRCGWYWCHVPPLFPCRSSSSCPLAVHCLLVPIVVIIIVPTPIPTPRRLGVLWWWLSLLSSPPCCLLFAIPSL